MDLTDAVRLGRRPGLEALRDRLAQALIDAAPYAVAPLARQLAEVLRQLDELPNSEVSVVDNLAARRAARRSNASGQ
jgi:hypothetical protein